ncbi:OmpP1/FadL family transporter [Mucilaginibacter sp.]|uniref:OmpP1/FadL family transporter n=1 Tax=Mucilaginibacter sp. TaxID=1882438 RepID=UPI000CC8DF77|nr:hypothetical protein [Mucilaginibacter sp.]PLW90466.1 MAG: hypothetical protein C0154_06270 [Mucilaginibacter sp.]HEK19830.1 hypothetical protein [Bacteroidota bacterium]
MKLRYILSVTAIVAFTQNTFAQYSQDAIRFSTGSPGSTSRIKAVGNAGTALGGDLSNLTGNPAGLGFFTRSELSITPELDGAKTNSTYFGQANTDSKNTFNLAHAGVVIYNPLTKTRGADKNKGWLSVNYGVGFARTNDLYSNFRYSGNNNRNSITNYFADQANQFGDSQGSLGGMAADQNLISLYQGKFASYALQGVGQEYYAERQGGQSAVDFSLGANYSNKLYLGLALSFTDLRYNAYNTFYEDGTLTVQQGVNQPYTAAYSQAQVTRGTGFAARVGAIYKPVEALRLGLTVSSPTFYNIDDTFSEGLSSSINKGTTLRDGSGDYSLNYNLRTPWKVAGGAAVFIKNIGFITGDVEYLDYSTAHLSSNDSYNADYRDNPDIKSLYRSAVNARIGAEIKATSFLAIRGGYGIMGSPNNDKSIASDIKTVSGGLGFRFGSYYVDATYTHSSGNRTIYAYDLGASSPAAYLRNYNNNGYLTLGYRF